MLRLVADQADRDERIEVIEEVLEKMDECARLLRSLHDPRINAYCLADFEGREGGWLGEFVATSWSKSFIARGPATRAAKSKKHPVLLAGSRSREPLSYCLDRPIGRFQWDVPGRKGHLEAPTKST